MKFLPDSVETNIRISRTLKNLEQPTAAINKPLGCRINSAPSGFIIIAPQGCNVDFEKSRIYVYYISTLPGRNFILVFSLNQGITSKPAERVLFDIIVISLAILERKHCLFSKQQCETIFIGLNFALFEKRVGSKVGSKVAMGRK